MKNRNEEKKKALSEYLEAIKELSYWKCKVSRLEQLDTYRSPGNMGAHSGGGELMSKPELAVIELESAKENEREALTKTQNARARVMAIIQTVPDADQRVVLLRHYIDGMNWREIAEAEGKSQTWATNLHGTAMKHIVLPSAPAGNLTKLV